MSNDKMMDKARAIAAKQGLDLDSENEDFELDKNYIKHIAEKNSKKTTQKGNCKINYSPKNMLSQNKICY